MKSYKDFMEGYVVSADKKPAKDGRMLPARKLKTNSKNDDIEKRDDERSKAAKVNNEAMDLAKADMGDVIKDFQKSDAPQFKGKSKEKKREMAIAAKLQADDDSKKEELSPKQKKIDHNKNGKIDAHDLAKLRKEEKAGDECSCCGNKIKEDGSCGCGSDCKHCGGKHKLDEKWKKMKKEELTPAQKQARLALIKKTADKMRKRAEMDAKRAMRRDPDLRKPKHDPADHDLVHKEEAMLEAAGFDKNSKAHQAAKKTVSGMKSVMKAEFHSDGSATVHTKPQGNPHISSTRAVDHHHDTHGLGYNRSEADYKKSSFKGKDGLTHKTTGDNKSGHKIHISEAVETMNHSHAKQAAHEIAKSHKNLKVSSYGNNHFVHHKNEQDGANIHVHAKDGHIHVDHEDGAFGSQSKHKSVADAVKHGKKVGGLSEGIIGAVAGGVLGSVAGPVGMAAGAYLGHKIQKSANSPKPAKPAAPKKKMLKNEKELDELNKSTLKSYADKAHQASKDHEYDAEHQYNDKKEQEKSRQMAAKRKAGVAKADAKVSAKEEVEFKEGFVVRYNNPKSEKHGMEKHFDNVSSAQKHADMGNKVDKVGGKYTVHKTNAKGHVAEGGPGSGRVSSQHVKQGIGIARDKRYAGGNMTGAVRAMDKLKKGLSDHPRVKDELRKQNESLLSKISKRTAHGEPSPAAKKTVRKMDQKQIDREYISRAQDKLRFGIKGEERQIKESHDDVADMYLRILHFIDYAADEMMDYIQDGGMLEEWVQHKLSKIFGEMETVHAWMEGTKRMTGMEADEDDDSMPDLDNEEIEAKPTFQQFIASLNQTK